MRESPAFSLIELIVWIAVAGILIAGVTMLVGRSFSVSRFQVEQARITDEARLHSERMAEDIRQAQYADCNGDGDTEDTEDTWLRQASPTLISFLTDHDNDGEIEKVTYELAGGELYRTVAEKDQSSGSTCVFTAGEAQKMTGFLVNEANDPLFQFFPLGSADSVSALAVDPNTGQLTPTDRQQTARVSINILVDVNPQQDPPAGQVGTDVTPRTGRRVAVVPAPSLTPSALPTPSIPPGTGSVSGRVCDPASTLWINGARVRAVSASGVELSSATTDKDGKYILQGVKSGIVTIEVTKGHFSSSETVNVFPNQLTAIPDANCPLEANDRILVTGYGYDRIEGLLDELNIPYEYRWFSTLGEVDFKDYDMIFINCGNRSQYYATPETYERMKNFVRGGGSIYASDYASTVIKNIVPGKIKWYSEDGMQRGDQGANVVDQQLAESVGSWTTVKFGYLWDSMDWIIDPDVRIYMSGSYKLLSYMQSTKPNIPLVVSFKEGLGTILYTSFHNEETEMPESAALILKHLVFEL